MPVRLPFRAALYSHTVHANGLSPVWVLCLVRSLLSCPVAIPCMRVLSFSPWLHPCASSSAPSPAPLARFLPVTFLPALPLIPSRVCPPCGRSRESRLSVGCVFFFLFFSLCSSTVHKRTHRSRGQAGGRRQAFREGAGSEKGRFFQEKGRSFRRRAGSTLDGEGGGGKKFLSSLKTSQCEADEGAAESSDLDCAKRFYFDTHTTAQSAFFFFQCNKEFSHEVTLYYSIHILWGNSRCTAPAML